MSKFMLDINNILTSQATVRTHKILPLFQGLVDELNQPQQSAEEVTKLQAEVERKEQLLVKSQESRRSLLVAHRKLKVAMRDYENLKRNHERMKKEYVALTDRRAKEKDKHKVLMRKITDLEVEVASLKKKLKKAGVK